MDPSPAPGTSFVDRIRAGSAPVRPITPQLEGTWASLVGQPLPARPRAVLFDVYGTLFTSGSGEIGTVVSARQNALEEAIVKCLADTGRTPPDAEIGSSILETFLDAIEREHSRKRGRGFPHPEVDIRAIWEEVFSEYPAYIDRASIPDFALAFELESNPVWPMPGAAQLLTSLARSVPIGIVSNAQFYTTLLFPALLGDDLDCLGMSPAMVALSYQAGIAKPDPALFSGPLAALAEQGIDSSEVVYIGNDMLNDVVTARKAGCMTMLFAGDKRSLRLRQGHDTVGDTLPDTVVQSLPAALPLLAGSEGDT